MHNNAYLPFFHIIIGFKTNLLDSPGYSKLKIEFSTSLIAFLNVSSDVYLYKLEWGSTLSKIPTTACYDVFS